MRILPNLVVIDEVSEPVSMMLLRRRVMYLQSRRCVELPIGIAVNVLRRESHEFAREFGVQCCCCEYHEFVVVD